MIQISGKEWNVLEVLWDQDRLHLNEISAALRPKTGWRTNTVHTYLKRMADKGLIEIDKECNPYEYHAMVSREECRAEKRRELLDKVYQGSAGDLIAAFLKEEKITEKERERLKKLIDEMEV